MIPVAWVLGTEFDECETVAKLIGLKITTNEFIAYKQLGSLKEEHKLSVSKNFIICIKFDSLKILKVISHRL